MIRFCFFNLLSIDKHVHQKETKHMERERNRKIEMKEGNVLFNDTLEHILFTVIWRHTYG